MVIVVDNSAGGEAALAAEVAHRLRDRGFDVEERRAARNAIFDTAIHLLSSGLAIRVPERPDRQVLEALEVDVRAALLHRPSLHRRSRSVPVHLGETQRVIEWIDLFG